MTDGVDDRPEDAADETSSKGTGQDRAKLRIIPPDGRGLEPDEDSPAEPDAEPDSETDIDAGADDHDGDDPASLPLPAMAPGTGGSRLDSDDFEEETSETTQLVAPVEEPVAEAEAGGVDDPEGDDHESDDHESDEGEEGEDTARLDEEETADLGDEEPPATQVVDVVAEEDATETSEQPLFSPPGVPGVRLHRAPPFRPPDDVGPEGEEPADEGAEDSPLIRVSADRLPEGPFDREQGPGGDLDVGRHAARPSPEVVLAAPETQPNPMVKILTGLAVGVVALVVILLGKTAFAGLVVVLVTWVSVEFFGALYASLTGDEETLHSPTGSGEQVPGDLGPVDVADADATAAMAVPSPETVAAGGTAGGLSLARRPAAYVGVGGTLACVVTTYLFGVEATGILAVATVLACLLWFTAAVPRATPPLEASLSVLGFLHVGLLGTFAMLVLRLEHGMALLLIVVILTVVSDVSAYGWGASFGRSPFFASVSPNKSFEGFLGSLVTTLVFAVIVVLLQGWLYDSVPLLGNAVQVLILAAVVVVTATFGDLAESLFKRDLAIKDVAAVLPGHGGFFDRLDAMLFSIPSAYVLFRLMGVADVG